MLPGILHRISFSGMKDNFTSIMPEAEQFFRGGQATFMNKGVNGRWRGVLTPQELEQCQAAVERELTPDCASWLEHGGDHEAAHAVGGVRHDLEGPERRGVDERADVGRTSRETPLRGGA